MVIKMGIKQDREYKAWKKVCKQIETILNIDSITLNKRKDVKDLCILIARWGNDFTKLHTALIAGGMSEEEAKPIFANKKYKLTTEKVSKK